MSSGFEHQDWNEVVLQKPIPFQQSKSNHKKKEDFENIQAPPKASQELKVALQQARITKKWNQKEMANQLKCTTQQIAKYENGKEVPSNAMIAKMEKVLGVRLPRNKNKKLKA